MAIIAKLIRKIINSVYGFDLAILDPEYEHPLYYYSDNGKYVPTYASDGAVAFDLIANLGERPEITLHPGDKYKVPTGLYIELPVNSEGRVVSRSGISGDLEVILLNGVGEIDFDYRGQVMVPLKNLSNEIRTIKNEERIAQMVVCRILKVKPISLPARSMMSETKRGTNGFNSTGTKLIDNSETEI